MSLRRNPPPTATIFPGRFGFTVELPNGKAVHADTFEEAQRIARKHCAILVRILGNLQPRPTGNA
jgi:hypothetical protein